MSVSGQGPAVHELNRKWVLFLHIKNKNKKYADNTQEIYEIGDIETFWRVFNNIPTPSVFFTNERKLKFLKKTGEIPASLSFFTRGISPSWEDPKNINGGEWSIRKFKNISEFDQLWQNTLLILIGENYEKSEHINGVRIVDCTRDMQVMYRLEIWFDDISLNSFFDKKIRELLNIPSD